MGQPSSQTIYQQPSQQEIAANKASDQQKAAALSKLNQAIYAESKGLRGMGGLYEWSGPTPWLAADPKAQAQQPGKSRPTDPTEGGTKTGPYKVPYNYPGGAAAWTTGTGIVPTKPGDTPGYKTSQGPPGDRQAPGYQPYKYTEGLGPYGDRTSPGWQPDTAHTGGGRDDRTDAGTLPKTASPYQQQVLKKFDKAAGLPAPTFKTAPNVAPTRQQYSQKTALQTGLVKEIKKPAVIQTPPQNPQIYAQTAAKKAGLPVKGPAAVIPKVTYTAGPTTVKGTLPTKPAVSTIPGNKPTTLGADTKTTLQPVVTTKSPAPNVQPVAPKTATTPAKSTTPTPKIVAAATKKPSIFDIGPSTGGGRR